jgi:hypothetical protein
MNDSYELSKRKNQFLKYHLGKIFLQDDEINEEKEKKGVEFLLHYDLQDDNDNLCDCSDHNWKIIMDFYKTKDFCFIWCMYAYKFNKGEITRKKILETIKKEAKLNPILLNLYKKINHKGEDVIYLTDTRS